ncbi:MAG: hypothetical protein M1836_004075 [Candelina mexicana]|nr:MAG: hypothetical protein M1836_004075 [Candelina mexicana]
MNIPNIALPPFNKDTPPSDSSGDVIISDVIGNDRKINIFAGFTRDIEAISKRLEDGTQNTTVLAPLNTEVMKLPRKPWEDPKDYNELGANAYDGRDGEDRAHRNLRRFVEAHIVPASPWKEGERAKTIGGNEVWYENRDGKKFVQPGDIEVASVANEVSNGQVWLLKGVVNYA